MKGTAVFHYALSAAEGFLSGACFCQAAQSEEKKHKVLMYTTSALWLAASVLDALMGGRELQDAKTLEINDGGNDND